MLIEYPTSLWDTFCSLDDANTIITSYVPDTTQWDALTDNQKEVYLRQATLIVNEKISVLPDTLEDNLKKATALLANHSIGINMQDDGKNWNVKVKDIKGIRTEYFAPNDPDNQLPDVVVSLLSVYNVQSSSSFSFNRD